MGNGETCCSAGVSFGFGSLSELRRVDSVPSGSLHLLSFFRSNHELRPQQLPRVPFPLRRPLARSTRALRPPHILDVALLRIDRTSLNQLPSSQLLLRFQRLSCSQRRLSFSPLSPFPSPRLVSISPPSLDGYHFFILSSPPSSSSAFLQPSCLI